MDWSEAITFYDNNFYFLSFLLMAYLPCIRLGVEYMEDKPPINLKEIMFFWNISLAFFSTCCVLNITLPLLKSNLFLTNESICTNRINDDKNMNKWQFYFVVSKFPEMFDTAWIIMRKRNLTYLQVWHHFSVCLYCWIIVYSPLYGEGGHGTYFAAMNSFVHMLMYLYYAITTKTKFRSDFIAKSITTIQITQMILGICIHIYKTINCSCIHLKEIYFGYLIYCSYLYLFVLYFYNRYINV